MKLSHNKINKIVLITITGLMMVILAWATYFIYFDVYKIIILVPTLSDLQMQVSFDIVRIDLFDQITDRLQYKTAVREVNWLNIRNPF
jgi:hypothetical protein